MEWLEYSTEETDLPRLRTDLHKIVRHRVAGVMPRAYTPMLKSVFRSIKREKYDINIQS